MADRGNHRNLGGKNRPGSHFLVERPQILHRAAASAAQNDICFADGIRQSDRACNALRRALSLHLRWIEHNLGQWPAPAENADHVAHRRAGRRGHERDTVRTGRDGLLVPLGEQAFRLQFSLELLKRKVERTCTVRNDFRHIKLHRACARERADARLDDDLHAVLQTEFQPHRIRTEHDRIDGRVFVLERHVVVPGRMRLVVRDFALHH